MINREKLSKMALIDMLMYLHLCNPAHGFTATRCVRYCGDCYKCRMDWLDEPVDAQPVKHGKWEETHISLCKWISEDEKEEEHRFYMAELKCSCCKGYNAVTFDLTLNKPDFCQLCGAKMDGDENENIHRHF